MGPFHPDTQQIPPEIIAFDITVVRENSREGVNPHLPPHPTETAGGRKQLVRQGHT